LQDLTPFFIEERPLLLLFSIEKDFASFDATGNDVLEQAGNVDASGSWHGVKDMEN